jgi:acetyltransferase
MRPDAGLNATFASTMARPGHLGFISQSGALCTAILDWSQREMVGFSAFVSVGSMVDVGWGDLIQYLGDDPQTRSIILYMESLDDARGFMSAAREIALTKPIIVIKPGRTEAGAKAAASHTGALTGQDDVFDAAFARCGVLRVNTIAEMFDIAEALDKQPRPQGPNLTILTNAGGPAVLATDRLLAEGGQLAPLAAATLQQLDRCLPAFWSHHNPVDILGDADEKRYGLAADILSKDPTTDGLLVILSPQAMTDPAAVAQQIAPYANSGRPVIASWMGGGGVLAGKELLAKAGIPEYEYPDAAAAAFQTMWKYSTNLKALYEVPDSCGPGLSDAGIRGNALIESVRAKGRMLLTELEAKQLFSIYDIPVVETAFAGSTGEAIAIADRIGYPVVLKLHSETITHKTEVDGVQLNLADASAVQAAFQRIRESVSRVNGPEHFQGVTVQPMIPSKGYELILGCSVDPQFGPVLLFGGGGQLVEIYKDHAIGLPPLNTTLARLLMKRTRIYRALTGIRGRKPVDLDALDRLLVRLGDLVVDQPAIKELDINPLFASPDGMLALDGRVALYPQNAAARPKPAIRPYPSQYVQPWTGGGAAVLIRPIRPEDEPLIARFHAQLSQETVYQRYFEFLSLDRRVTHDRLVRICFNDYDRQIALVVEAGEGEARQIVAIARLTKTLAANEGELAFLIADTYQGHGLGTELGRRLIEIARNEQLDRLFVEFLQGNAVMLNLARDLGFVLTELRAGVQRGNLLLGSSGG